MPLAYRVSVSTVPLTLRNRAYPSEIASNPSGSRQWELNHRPTWSYEWLVLPISAVQTQVNGNLRQVWGECLCHWRVEQLIHISWRISGDKYIHQWNFMKSKQSNSPYVQYWPTSKCNLVGWVYRHHEISWPMTMKSHRVQGHSRLGNKLFHHQSWSQFMNENRNEDSNIDQREAANEWCYI